MAGKTISERILSAKSGTDARAGDVVVSKVDWVLGTDAAGPMAINYFERMGGTRVFDPSRVMFALDHYAPPTPKTQGFHDQIRDFAARHGAEVRSVGVWHSAQPALTKWLRPRAIDAEPPGVSGDAFGGARKRWKLAKFSIAVLPA